MTKWTVFGLGAPRLRFQVRYIETHKKYAAILCPNLAREKRFYETISTIELARKILKLYM